MIGKKKADGARWRPTDGEAAAVVVLVESGQEGVDLGEELVKGRGGMIIHKIRYEPLQGVGGPQFLTEELLVLVEDAL